ncbi:helix-turn-helix domain-containing protein [Hymenobacter rubidus]|uniref:helix-turn-helix domain-containing protein n=1 Tax=Hymenobacter rubidus TaxID=1441626 RepID=UPI0019202398|nr:helix-turn-helix domain-containing protein [Hymenobacter rubidus]
MNTIKPIRTEADYREALARVEALFEALPGTPEFDELDILGTLVCAYEDQHYPIPEPDPIEYIKYKMAERGLRQRDLAAWLGGESRVSEILNRKRKLTAKMMKALHDNLGLSAEMLLAAA